MLKFSSLSLKLEIVFLEHFNQLFEVIGSSLVLKLHLFSLKAKIRGYISKLAQIRIFLQIFSHLVAQGVMVSQKFLNLRLLVSAVYSCLCYQCVIRSSSYYAAFVQISLQFEILISVIFSL